MKFPQFETWLGGKVGQGVLEAMIGGGPKGPVKNAGRLLILQDPGKAHHLKKDGETTGELRRGHEAGHTFLPARRKQKKTNSSETDGRILLALPGCSLKGLDKLLEPLHFQFGSLVGAGFLLVRRGPPPGASPRRVSKDARSSEYIEHHIIAGVNGHIPPSGPGHSPSVQKVKSLHKAFHRTYRIRYGEWDPRTVRIRLQYGNFMKFRP
ncbi:hypothetical protein B0H13DRAFT_1862812 [Mycena leptocephala]|nr:hypothetical protein B0H13DRAFT_1862812 [Mycena leptocephala]